LQNANFSHQVYLKPIFILGRRKESARWQNVSSLQSVGIWATRYLSSICLGSKFVRYL